MELRTYHANTVESAFALAKRDFGDEAMLIGSTRFAPGSDPRGEYEVVFAGEPLPAPIRPPAEIAPALSKVKPFLPRVISPVSASYLPELVRGAKSASKETTFGPIDLVRGRAIPILPAAAAAVQQSATPALQLSSRRPAASKNTNQLRTVRRSLRVVCNPGVARFESSSYSIALVGPTGAGKTTTAMKLAVRYGLLASRPCRVIAYDPDRVGTTERLRHFSNLLKIPFEAVETPSRLAAAISLKTEGLTIIDTPGCSAPADDRILAGLAFLLGPHPEVETQLVLRADRKVADNIASASRLSALAPKRLIVTALDETSDYQDLETLARATSLPFSFLGIGQRVPDDLEPASLQRLEDLINHGWSTTVAAAA